MLVLFLGLSPYRPYSLGLSPKKAPSQRRQYRIENDKGDKKIDFNLKLGE